MTSSSGRVARSSCRYWSMWACIVAQVLLLLALLVWLWLSADPNCCSFANRNSNRCSAGVVDAGVDGVAVDDDAGVAGVWWMLSWKKTNRETKMPVFYVVYNHFRFEIIFVSITIKFSALSFPFPFSFPLTKLSLFQFQFLLTNISLETNRTGVWTHPKSTCQTNIMLCSAHIF